MAWQTGNIAAGPKAGPYQYWDDGSTPPTSLTPGGPAIDMSEHQWASDGDGGWSLQGMPSKDWGGEKLLKSGLELTAATGMGVGALGMLGAGGAIGAGAGGGLTGAGVSAGTSGAIDGGLATGGSLAGGATAGNAATGGFLDFISSPEFTGSFDPGGAGMTAGGPGGMAGGANAVGGSAMSNLPFGLQSKDLAMGGINFGLNQYLANQAKNAGASAANTSNAMNDPRRQPFQQAANDMVQNPQDYFKNNPFATSMADFYKNGVIPANIAKSGNTGFDTDRLGAQFATAVGGNYNALLQQLQGFGGYNQGAGFAGTNQLQGDMAANNFQAESFRGLGKASEGIFGTPEQPKTPQQNPITGSYTVIQ